MANVSLQHIKKVYPNTESKKKKKGEPEKKSNLQVKASWRYRISTWRSPTGSSSCW